MEETLSIKVTADEALMIVTALGTYQNRIGQHSSWAERKRIPLLEQQLTDETDEEQRGILQKKLKWTQRYIAKSIADGERCNLLKDRIKADTGITDEKHIDKV